MSQPLHQIFCPNCKGGNPTNAQVCQWCGYSFQQQGQYTPPPGPIPPQQVVYVQPKGQSCILPIVIGTIVVCGIAVAILATSRKTDTPSITGSNGIDLGTATPSKPGDTVSVGSWKVRVDKVAQEKEFDWSGFGNKQTAKGVYAEVFVTAENTTNKQASVNSFDYKLIDNTGAEFSSCSELACYSYPSRLKLDNFNTEIPPRTASKLLAIFDVATDAKDLMLVIENKARIHLGNLP